MNKPRIAWCLATAAWLLALAAAFAPEPAALASPTDPGPATPATRLPDVSPGPAAAPTVMPAPTVAKSEIAPAAPLEPAWMVDPNFRHGLEDNILELRAKRAVQPPAGHIHQEEVIWTRHEDAAGAILRDGRSLKLGRGNVALETALAWEPGTRLLLVYSEADGAVLIEPRHGNRFEVVVISGPHPLDAYQREMEGHVSTTMDTLALAYEMRRLWGLESDRCVREVLANPHVPPAVKENLVLLTHVRKEHEDAYRRHVMACLRARHGHGSMSTWDFSEINKSFSRSLALDLLAVRDAARDFDDAYDVDTGE